MDILRTREQNRKTRTFREPWSEKRGGGEVETANICLLHKINLSQHLLIPDPLSCPGDPGSRCQQLGTTGEAPLCVCACAEARGGCPAQPLSIHHIP